MADHEIVIRKFKLLDSIHQSISIPFGAKIFTAMCLDDGLYIFAKVYKWENTDESRSIVVVNCNQMIPKDTYIPEVEYVHIASGIYPEKFYHIGDWHVFEEVDVTESNGCDFDEQDII